MGEQSITVEVIGAVARVTLRRPGVRNAFNAELIGLLRDSFVELSGDATVRAIVLEGEGKVFCGGADLNWMRASLELSKEENIVDATHMSDMYRAIDGCPKPVIARVQGAALGGGAGLCAVADIVVAADTTAFGFSETKLGILPATIGPFAIAKIGYSNARRYFLTGERFDAATAQRIGLVHEVVPEDGLDARVDGMVGEVLTASPTAVAAAKRAVATIRDATYEQTRDLMAQALAAQRVSPEGQEGVRAFLERRKASWIGR